jgi:hypothetical protein
MEAMLPKGQIFRGLAEVRDTEAVSCLPRQERRRLGQWYVSLSLDSL